MHNYVENICKSHLNIAKFLAVCGQKNNAYDNNIYSECICLEIPHRTNMGNVADKQNCVKGNSPVVRKKAL